MTLDKLAQMVARGFEKTATKEELTGLEERVKTGFENIDERLTGVEQRLGKVENGIDEMHEILTRFEEGDILDLQKRIKILERAVKAISKQIS